MFTGIVVTVGTLSGSPASGSSGGGDLRISVRYAPGALGVLSAGASVCVSGACLTVLDPRDDGFDADVSTETLSLTTLGERVAESGESGGVNLEPAATLATPLGGHLVSGHVDGVGNLVSRHADARSARMRFRLPGELARYVAAKGSVCIDGVSLTVNAVDGSEFEVNLIPHTLTATTLGALVAGSRVNIEVDLIARYLERLLDCRAPPAN